MKKDDFVTIEIEDIGADGAGIGKMDGFALFIKDALPGDLVEAKIMKLKKNYGYARLMNILRPSPDRVEPQCPVARSCGGCQLQAMDYSAQLQFKERKIKNNLQRIGGFHEIPMEPILGMETPYAYRNKAQFPIGRGKDGRIITGFYAGRTHSIIENKKCLLGVPQNEEVLERLLSYMEENQVSAYDEKTGTGLIRHVLIRYGFSTGQLMVCVIVNGKRLPKEERLTERLLEIPGMKSITLNVNREKTNVILGKEVRVLWGQEYIEDQIGDVSYRISPLSFYQVNPVQTKKLYEKALEFAGLSGEETVWDLYCGIGTISLFLAQKAKQVYGVEIVPEAIADAKENARINGIQNVEFYVGRAEDVLPQKYEKEGVYADVIVVDPPRKGCAESLLKTIVDMKPEKVVYVSCDSATLARDLRYLCDRGYELARVQGVDQFPQTTHVETVVLLTRKREEDLEISEKLLEEICSLAREYEIEKVILFGSRARGDQKRTSDVDLAVLGGNVSGFAAAVEEETSTLLEFDVVNLGGTVQEELLEAIREEGKTLYEEIR